MYQLTINVIQRDGQVIIDASMYEYDADLNQSYLGDMPKRHFVAASKGHDWLGDCELALENWVEMSLFSRESVSGVSTENRQG